MQTEKDNKYIILFCISLIFLPLKYQPTKFAVQIYPHLKNLNFPDLGKRLGEIYLTLDSNYLWKLVSGKVICGMGDEPRGIDKDFGYVLSDPVMNVEGIKMNHKINHYYQYLTNIREELF